MWGVLIFLFYLGGGGAGMLLLLLLSLFCFLVGLFLFLLGFSCGGFVGGEGGATVVVFIGGRAGWFLFYFLAFILYPKRCTY